MTEAMWLSLAPTFEAVLCRKARRTISTVSRQWHRHDS